MSQKKIFQNIIYGFGGKILTMAFGLIVPRLLLTGYGSEVNGLFSTVNNIYTYLALLEAGIGTSAIQMLYKPINNDDKKEINKILSTVRLYYHKISKLYLGCVIACSCILPVILSTSISKSSIFAIVMLQGMASVLNFWALSGINVLLSSEGKQYVISNIALVTSILTNIAKIVLVNMQVNIVILQLSYFVISMISILIYLIYLKKNYPWIDRNQYDEKIVLKQRGAFLISNIVYVIFNNTDTIIISIFCGLKYSSVYAIYNMIFVYVLNLINSIFSGLSFLLGKTYNEDKEKYIKVHDAYKSMYCAFVFAMFTVCYILIIPFLKLYTHGVNDIAYIDKYLPLLFCLANLLSTCRSTENNLISLAFHAKQTIPRTCVEAIINIVISLILVNKVGIYGCLIGTIASLLYRTNDIIIYANTKILNRKPRTAYITVISNFLMFFLICIISQNVVLNIDGYFSFFRCAVIISVILLIVYYLLAFGTNRQSCLFLFKQIKKEKIKKVQ